MRIYFAPVLGQTDDFNQGENEMKKINEAVGNKVLALFGADFRETVEIAYDKPKSFALSSRDKVFYRLTSKSLALSVCELHGNRIAQVVSAPVPCAYAQGGYRQGLALCLDAQDWYTLTTASRLDAIADYFVSRLSATVGAKVRRRGGFYLLYIGNELYARFSPEQKVIVLPAYTESGISFNVQVLDAGFFDDGASRWFI